MTARRLHLVLVLTLLAAVPACDDDPLPCSLLTGDGCAPELACETVAGSETPRCLPPVVVRGLVRDRNGGAPVVGARVSAYDLEDRAVGAAATSIFDGSYEIRIASPRDSAGKPLTRRLRVRASAPGFGDHPDGWSVWPSFDLLAAPLTNTAGTGQRYLLSTGDTNVDLIAFAGGPGIGTLCGTVPVAAGEPAPVVVAEFTPIVKRSTVSAHADATGAYLLAGIPPGPLAVRAYQRGRAFTELRFDLNAGESTCRDIGPSTDPVARVTGQLELAGGAAGTPTVSLIVAATYDAATGLGIEPTGLRAAAGADGSFAIEGVPPGRYVVIASAENDGLVATAAPPTVDVVGPATVLPGKIRLAPAIAVLGPGAGGPEGVSQGPFLSWSDSALEESYRVTVTSYLGQTIFTRDERKHSGDSPMLVLDRPLTEGMLYRLVVEALDDQGRPITRTEDAKGIFFLQ